MKISFWSMMLTFMKNKKKIGILNNFMMYIVTRFTLQKNTSDIIVAVIVMCAVILLQSCAVLCYMERNPGSLEMV